LLEEFPDVTISKIRFLESQGLISPERTPSGYRKFYDADVELLRVILTEQRKNYLPLRVIKDRLEDGEIDPTGEQLRPDGDESAEGAAPGAAAGDAAPSDAHDEADQTPAEVPEASIASHPASRHARNGAPAASRPPDDAAEGMAAQLLPGVLLDRDELCAMVGLAPA